MIKTLQKRFVVTAMTAITVLIMIMLGAINVANIIIVDKDMDETLSLISENEGEYVGISVVPEFGQPTVIFTQPKNELERFMSATFFLVRFDRNGNVVYTDLSRTSSVSQEQAIEMAIEVYNSHSAQGRSGKFRYAVRNARMGGGTVMVFLDTSEEILSYVRVLFLSAVIGLACWLIMFLFVVFLSKKAIKPIAENMERQKRFITDAGHEIKTPLAIIQANTDAMELYNGENKWSKNIKAQVTRLNGLMKNMLTLARMDEGAGEISLSDFSFNEILDKAVQDFSEPIKMKNITLQSEIQPQVMLHANQEQIEQLLSILLDNAVKYTPDDGEITAVLKKDEKSTVLTLSNTLDSIPNTSPEKLFERFYRADEARTQKSGGYGIGLSVAQSIVLANKGSISASYEQPDKIIFTVKF